MSEKLRLSLKQADIVIHEPVKLRGGAESAFYVDVKKAYGRPYLLKGIAEALIEKLNPETTCIAATGYGGIPLSAAVSLATELPLTLVRDKPKNHGRGGLIDGYTPLINDHISIVDDVYTSGSSIRETEAILSNLGNSVIGGLVVVKRGDVTQSELPISYLFTPEDIMR